MSEKDPKKKGLLAGLLELLGEDEENEESRPEAVASPGESPPGEPELRQETKADPQPVPADPRPADVPESAAPPAVHDVAPAAAASQTPPPQAETAPVPPEPSAPEPPVPPAAAAAEPAAADAASTPAPVHQEEPAVDPEYQRLTSPVVEERRAAIREIVASGLTDHAVGSVIERLLVDPELDIRMSSLEALAQRPDRLEASVLRQALQDPVDDVRAGAVRLLASLGAVSTNDLARLIGQRRWPQMQRTTLELLPQVIQRYGIDDDQTSALLEAAGRLDTQPVGMERQGFAALARAAGRDRLLSALGGSDVRRLGAARLLLEEGSPAALDAVARLEADPLEDVRVVAALARSMRQSGGAAPMSERAGPTPPPVPPPPPPTDPGRGVDAGVGADLVAGLARTLSDPDESVRVRARDALTKANRATVTRWVRGALRSGSEEDAVIAAQVAEALGVTDVAIDVLERAAGASADQRGAFARTLGAFEIDPATLAGLVRSIEATRRPDAIQLLWQLCGHGVLPYLRPFLQDSSGAVRMAVLGVIGDSGEPDTDDVAHRVLETDSSPSVRATAVKILARADVDRRLVALSQALADGDPDVRATAVEVLLDGIARHASQYLLRATEDADERVRGAALRHLATLGTDDFAILWSALRHCTDRQRDELLGILEQQGADRLAALAQIHLDSPSPTDRALAVQIAGLAGTPECIRQTIGALQDPAPGVRRTAAAALSGMRSPEAIPALASALKDPNPKVRIEAVGALGMIDDDQVIPVLITALKDPEVRVRDTAANVLIRWSSPGVARQLVDALGTTDLKRAAGDLLARMGQTALEPLVEMLLRGSPDLMPTIGELLQKITGPDPFLDELASLDPVRRLRAVEALGAMGGPRAVDGLIRALADPDERIRTRSLQHLGRLGDPRAYEEVRRAFASDPVLEVVEAAEEALQRLEPGQ